MQTAIKTEAFLLTVLQNLSKSVMIRKNRIGMKYGMRKLFCFVTLLLALTVPAWAEGAPTEISTPEDLAAMANDPSGSYVLTEDLDMEGITWNCFDFSGTLDGNGHSILNLSVTQPGENTETALDGNQKEYPAVYAGLFSKLEGAEVKNLNLVNIRALVETDQPCFLGGIAGYSMDSSVSGCTVTGQMELRVHEGILGVAGVLGYGVGTIDGCTVDVTLICVDTDAQTSDEQFLGGAFATGFMSVTDCNIRLDAYISEHGFVHSGGVAGMLLQYPIGMGKSASITGNTIDAGINFFEHSTKRRAYCGEVVGELLKTMNFNYGVSNNTRTLRKNEVKTYDTELRPEKCAEPHYTETVVPSDCQNYGYTEYTCDTCGYSFRDHYQLHAHTVSLWTTEKAATESETGLSTGICDVCGETVERVDPVLTAPEETQPETEPEALPTVETPKIYSAVWVWAMVGALVVAVAAIVWLLFFGKPREKAKHEKRYNPKKGGKYAR